MQKELFEKIADSKVFKSRCWKAVFYILFGLFGLLVMLVIALSIIPDRLLTESLRLDFKNIEVMTSLISSILAVLFALFFFSVTSDGILNKKREAFRNVVKKLQNHLKQKEETYFEKNNFTLSKASKYSDYKNLLKYKKNDIQIGLSDEGNFYIYLGSMLDEFLEKNPSWAKTEDNYKSVYLVGGEDIFSETAEQGVEILKEYALIVEKTFK